MIKKCPCPYLDDLQVVADVHVRDPGDRAERVVEPDAALGADGVLHDLLGFLFCFVSSERVFF